ncbi:MAG: hypothetical protein GF311_28395 [Candidatus Lokiarchaeota archaeon]|nr:hypothetical protein [Candidatus Lokiarchaeota archaeon]
MKAKFLINRLIFSKDVFMYFYLKKLCLIIFNYIFMSGIRNKLEKASLKIKRKLFDNQIFVMGNQVQVTHIKIEKDEKYGNWLAPPALIKNDVIDCVIDYPTEIPLYRYRYDDSGIKPDNNETGSNTSYYFYDILPIEIYTKWNDNVEKDDVIIHKIEDDDGGFFKIAMQVTDMFGSFHTALTWKKSWAAPYIYELPAEIKNIIDQF